MKEERISDSTPGVVPWPKPINQTGRFGIAGEFIDLIKEHTEADENAVLIAFLTYCGNCMGRNFFVTAGADQHFANLFTCIVGSTGIGRKGSAMSVVEAFFTHGQPPRLGHRLKGMSTGESVVYEAHDDIFKFVHNKKDNNFVRVLAEPNEPEKRVLYQLAEFQQCLAGMRKQDSILPSILRTAWDKGDLATPAKTSRATATGAHVSILTAMSRDELVKLTDDSDAESGLLNRFLFCCSRRSKLLPQGGRFYELYKSEKWKNLQRRVAENIDTMEEQVQLKRDENAEECWGLNNDPHHGLYKTLNTPRVGLLGAVTARAPQQVLRLAIITATINGPVFPAEKGRETRDRYLISSEHLDAASEIWRYCDDSCKWIWGDKLDDPVAAKLMEKLRAKPEGMTRSEIYRVWNGHVDRGDIDRTLLWTAKAGIARVERIQTGGRPVETWHAC